MAKKRTVPMDSSVRVGEAAELLGVSVDTLRRWTASGVLRMRRSAGGQRLVALADIRRLQQERRQKSQRPIVAQSARNRFPGVITEVKRDGLAATVEIQAGPHRVLAFITREAADQMKLEVGMHAIATVKATSVMVNLPGD